MTNSLKTKMKRKLPIIIFISTFILLSISGIAHAEMKYTLLESFPGFFTAGTAGPTFPAMILAIYKFGIWTVGIAGLFMLVIGGFWYMTSAGNNSTAETAKKIIWDSLLGIVAALSAYLILFVINPDLTKINIAFIKVDLKATTTGTGGTPSTTATTGTAGAGVAHGEIISAAEQMMNQGCIYNQPKRNGCSTNPGYTDCSDFVCTSYKKAGCTCLGTYSGNYGDKAQSIGDPNSLKAGDVIWVPGHVVMCTANGCSQVIAAAGEGKNIKYSNGSYYYNQGKVVKASDYCK